MPKVICTLPNASQNINGVKFTPTEDGMAIISEAISNADAELFFSIPGYEPEFADDESAAAAQAELDAAAAHATIKPPAKAAGKNAPKASAAAPAADPSTINSAAAAIPGADDETVF